ncbi:MAG: alpha-E domain-containing protein, partial [Myxococcota bacterium]
MISRVAESCFWLHRYVERAENTARLLRVNRSFILDVSLPVGDRWAPAVIVAGEQDRLPEVLSPEAVDDGELVQDYMTWNDNNPVSLLNSIRWARENARTIREVISLEMWEAVNELWHWLQRGPGRRMYSGDRDAFYARIKAFAALFYGVCDNTLLREQPFDFMRLGMLLERTGQIARIIDVKHHAIGPTALDDTDSAIASAQWLALLRSCSATEVYFKRVRESPKGATVLPFLVLEDGFPRSIVHCLARAWEFMQRIR